MSLYHCAQLLLAFAVVALAVHRWRRLSRTPTPNVELFVSAVLRHRRAGRTAELEALLTSTDDSWLGRVVRAALEMPTPRTGSTDADEEPLSLDEVLAEQRYDSSQGMLALRVSMTLGSVSGLLGALYEIVRLPAARHSLLGLVPGLPEQRAFESAMISVGIGVGVALFAGLALSRLRRRSKRLYAESLEAATRIEESERDASA